MMMVIQKIGLVWLLGKVGGKVIGKRSWFLNVFVLNLEGTRTL